ncbi:MAG: hypothetical protein U0Y68_06540 [Blastocatellia bacterium]
MKTLYFTCACFLLLAFSVSAQTPRPMTFDDVMALKTVGTTAISPDGKWIAYTLAYADMKENERHTEIWMVAADGGNARRFTTGKNDTTPTWSPDGQWLAFLSTRGTGEATKPQIYVISPFGGEAEKLTEAKAGVSSFAWAPDSKRLAYVAQVPLTDAEEKKQKDKDDAQVVDANFRFSHLWTIDVEAKKATEVVKADLVLSDPQFSPDGKRLSYTALPTTKANDGNLSDVYIAPIQTAATRRASSMKTRGRTAVRAGRLMANGFRSQPRTEERYARISETVCDCRRAHAASTRAKLRRHSSACHVVT